MSKNQEELTDDKFIKFDDFAKIYESFDLESHVIVSKCDDHHPDPPRRKESYLVMSALIDLGDIPKYLKVKDGNNGWPFRGLGEPDLWAEGDTDEISFDLGQWQKSDGVNAHYFVRRYHPHGMGKPSFPITQSFTFYYELLEYPGKNKRVFVDELEDTEVVVELSGPYDTHLVRVNRHYLREYLTARKLALAVWVVVSREVTTKLKVDLKDAKKDRSTYLLALNPSSAGADGTTYRSELICKFVVKPYRDIKWSRRLYSSTRHHVPMVVGINSTSGRKIRSRSANQFKPIYFKKEVLVRYVEDRRCVVRLLTKEIGRITYLDQWYLTYGINQMGRLVVWDKYLDRLPHNEKIYWSSFNIPPEGWLPEEFRQAAIFGNPPTSTSLEEQVIKLRTAINGEFNKRHGVLLFSDNEDDEYNIQQLHVVTGRGSLAIRPQILALSKLFIDSIDGAMMAKKIADPKDTVGPDGKKLRGLSLLQNYYNQESGTEYQVTSMLKLVWDLRSNYIHKFSEKSYMKKIESYSSRLDPLDPHSVYTYILEQTTHQLGAFHVFLAFYD